MKYSHKYSSIIGDIFIEADDKALLYVGFSVSKNENHNKTNNIIEEATKQLNEYFNHKRKVFDLPLNPTGTEFQKLVWHELKKIPYGETRTYKQIATNIGNKNASRTVGNANNKNPISIIIPCHRVIGSNKKLIGYAGGIDIKQKLLNIENTNK